MWEWLCVCTGKALCVGTFLLLHLEGIVSAIDYDSRKASVFNIWGVIMDDASRVPDCP